MPTARAPPPLPAEWCARPTSPPTCLAACSADGVRRSQTLRPRSVTSARSASRARARRRRRRASEPAAAAGGAGRRLLCARWIRSGRQRGPWPPLARRRGGAGRVVAARRSCGRSTRRRSSPRSVLLERAPRDLARRRGVDSPRAATARRRRGDAAARGRARGRNSWSRAACRGAGASSLVHTLGLQARRQARPRRPRRSPLVLAVAPPARAPEAARARAAASVRMFFNALEVIA